jgi:hypothetical protein
MVLLEGYVVAYGGLWAQKRCVTKPPSTTSTITCLYDTKLPCHLHVTASPPRHLVTFHSHSLYRSTLSTCSLPNSRVDHLDNIPFPQTNSSYIISNPPPPPPPDLSTFNGGGGPGKVVFPTTVLIFRKLG